MNREGAQWEQLIRIIPLASATEVVIHFDEAALLQLFDGPPHRTVRDTTGFRDSPLTGVAAVCFVVAAQQVAVDGKWYRQ